MGKEDCDTEQFIREIEFRPAIWNIELEEYKDRSKRKVAWDEICAKFFPTYDEMESTYKNDIALKLLHKWRNLRDSYVKSLKAENQRTGLELRKRRSYVYSDQLSFLNKVLSLQPNETEITRETFTFQDCDDSFPESVTREVPNNPIPRAKRRKKDKSDHRLTTPDYQENNFVQPDLHGDDAFFASIMPMIRNFSEDQKIEFRLEVLNIIKNVKRRNFLLPDVEASTSRIEPATPVRLHYAPPVSVWQQIADVYDQNNRAGPVMPSKPVTVLAESSSCLSPELSSSHDSLVSDS